MNWDLKPPSIARIIWGIPPMEIRNTELKLLFWMLWLSSVRKKGDTSRAHIIGEVSCFCPLFVETQSVFRSVYSVHSTVSYVYANRGNILKHRFNFTIVCGPINLHITNYPV